LRERPTQRLRVRARPGLRASPELVILAPPRHHQSSSPDPSLYLQLMPVEPLRLGLRLCLSLVLDLDQCLGDADVVAGVAVVVKAQVLAPTLR